MKNAIQVRKNQVVKSVIGKFGIECKAEIKLFEKELEYIEMVITNGNRYEVSQHVSENFDRTHSIIIIDEFTAEVYNLADTMHFTKSAKIINGINGKVISEAKYSNFDLIRACEIVIQNKYAMAV